MQPALSAVGQYYHHRRALVMGIVAAGSRVGGVCLPIMFSRLIPRIGFPWMMRVGALDLLTCYAAAICLSRAKHQPRKLKSFGSLLDYRCLRMCGMVLFRLERLESWIACARHIGGSHKTATSSPQQTNWRNRAFQPRRRLRYREPWSLHPQSRDHR